MERAIRRALIEAGYTRQWRYKRDIRVNRVWLAEELGLRWCLNCGRDLDEDAPINALYCSKACRSRASQKRRARGCWTGYLKRPRVLDGQDLDFRKLSSERAQLFYMAHGVAIEHAPEICRCWGHPPRDGLFSN